MDNNVEKKVILATLRKIRKRLKTLAECNKLLPYGEVVAIERNAIESSQKLYKINPKKALEILEKAQKEKNKWMAHQKRRSKNWEKWDKEDIALMAEERTLLNRLSGVR